jgi:hypothetical protein
MVGDDRTAVLGAVTKGNRRRLIPILKDIAILFCGMDEGEFDRVALRLNDAPHLGAGVASRHVACAAADQAAGRRRPDGSDDRPGLGAEAEALGPR